jgi:hypothetical protein
MTWEKIRAAIKRASQTVLGPIGAVLVIIAAVVLVSLGGKNIQIGGILGALLGKKRPQTKAIDTANSIPKDRIGKDGKLIPLGQADEKGITQVAVVPINAPGLFGDPNTVQFKDPRTAQPVEVALPVGVKAGDVEHVIVVQPGQFAVTVKDSSPVSGEQIDTLLSKYKI